MKKLILSILFILCLSFQASAWNPMVVVSGGGAVDHCTTTECAGCDGQERMECGSTDGNEELTWATDAAGTTINFDYTTTVLSGTESLYLDGDAIVSTTFADHTTIYVTAILRCQGSATQAFLYLGDGGTYGLALQALWVTDHYVLKVHYNGITVASQGTTEFVDDQKVYVKFRYIKGTGADGQIDTWIETDNPFVGWDLQNDIGNSTDQYTIDQIRLKGDLAATDGTIFDDIRWDADDISY